MTFLPASPASYTPCICICIVYVYVLYMTLSLGLTKFIYVSP